MNKREMFQALESELMADSRARGLNVRARVHWVSERLEEFISRWVSFCSIPAAPDASLPSDLFTVIEVGAELLGRHPEQCAPPVSAQKAYDDLIASMRRVRPETQRNEADNVRAAMDHFRREIESKRSP